MYSNFEMTENKLATKDPVIEEFHEVSRPWGSFERKLFAEDVKEKLEDRLCDVQINDDLTEELRVHEGDQCISNDEDVDIEGSKLVEQYICAEVDTLEAQFGFEDIHDIENLPLDIRLNHIGCRLKGEKTAYISQDKNICWAAKPVLQNSNNILQMRLGNVLGIAQEAKTPLDAWKLFITDEMIETITVNTNISIEKCKSNYSRQRDCLYTNFAEVRAVIGLLYLAGAMEASHESLKDVFASAGSGDDFFSLVMSIKKFRFLLQVMNFDNLNTRCFREEFDNMAAIRDFFQDFVENCQNNYAISEFATMDEMLEPFRGQCSFRVFMKNKPVRYGMKIVTMACARTFYVNNLEVFVGNQPEGPLEISNSPEAVVERLIQPISKTGRNVTLGNRFTSLALCANLLNNHQLTLVGSMKKNMGEVPQCFVESKGNSFGSTLFGFKHGCTLVSYKDKKTALLSSLHRYDTSNDPTTQRSTKYEIEHFYESSKGAVDYVEKQKEAYTVARKTGRWPMRLFYWILDIAGINSFVVLKANLKDENMTRRGFLTSLGKELCKELMSARVNVKSIPKLTKIKACKLLGLTEQLHRPPDENITRGRCFRCAARKNRATKKRCKLCRHFICREHTAPAQCLDCIRFAEYDLHGWLSMVVINSQIPPACTTFGRCKICSRKNNRKTRTRCIECQRFICREHAARSFCVKCIQFEDEGITVATDAPGIVKLQPPHSHPPSTAETDAAAIRCRMREMVRKCPELQAADVLREVLPSCSPEVRELLCRNLDTIRRDMHRTRARMARVAAAAGLYTCDIS